MVIDSRSLNCNTLPGADYGQDCNRLLHRMAQLPFVDTDMYYNIIATATFCVKCAHLYTMRT